jgi:biotin carboxyl carrier protein
MSTFEITIEGKLYKVTVEKFDGKQASVVVDGKKYEVDIDGMDFRRPPPSFGRGPYTPRPGIKTPTISQSNTAAVPTPTSAIAPAAGGGGKITAPMPGLILDVMVKEGDHVKSGEMVVKMEAMKMENEIPSSVDGIVKSVAVQKGDSVSTGETLVEIGG